MCVYNHELKALEYLKLFYRRVRVAHDSSHLSEHPEHECLLFLKEKDAAVLEIE